MLHSEKWIRSGEPLISSGKYYGTCDAVTRNCDSFIVTTRNCDILAVATRNYDFFFVTTRNCVVVFRNYGSQCERSYA